MPAVPAAEHVPFKHPPKLEIRTREQVRAFVLAQLEDSATQRDLAGKEAAYKVLGLIPDTMNVRRLFVDLLTEQILGYYDPKTKVLYVMNGAPDDIVGITIMHELVHALQDQYFNLDSLQHASGDDDRQLAAQAVIEGEAVYEQMRAMVGNNGSLAARSNLARRSSPRMPALLMFALDARAGSRLGRAIAEAARRDQGASRVLLCDLEGGTASERYGKERVAAMGGEGDRCCKP